MTTIAPVDQATAERVVRTLQSARTACLSPVTALNMQGLLNTDLNARAIRRDTLINLAEVLRVAKVKDLQAARIIPKDASPAVVLRGISRWVEELAAQAERGEFR